MRAIASILAGPVTNDAMAFVFAADFGAGFVGIERGFLGNGESPLRVPEILPV
jgi:hypothetical protein